jgi:DNA-binding NarL/FixJ family response regulator
MIVEDHLVVADGVKRILSEANIEVIEVSPTWEVAAARYPALNPDVVLLDLNVPPDGNGLHLLPKLLKIDPNACVVCLSAATEPSEILEALEAGCAGFISKIADPDELPPLIELARLGDIAVDKRTAAKLIAASRRQASAMATASLSQREVDVLEMIAKGLSNQEIADVLCVSRTAVSDALTRAYRKLGARDRASATRIAMERGLVIPT